MWPLVLAAFGLLGGGLIVGWGLAPAISTSPPVAVSNIVTSAANTQLQALRDSLQILKARSAASPGAAPTEFTYVVRRGDTLRGIAWRLYGRAALASRLQQENNIHDPRRLPIGRRLRLFTL
ncbi:LysM peptidoglycan-binding domain-containing protein [Hymenobacter taeanensis]|uniref:LysM peptidoglycan-binding domain-containing protein n=1 Tax=Hymenobacter taeanensis TaxID=2735321 RepID=A0A6M6BI62_9BACT|nr:LysM domain-containing protein [Hymenobacter taeanensis]QJX47827.1 LysM peptidoglycan-binding domain-containing protein [Hymenobacter taeanensis]